MKIQIDNTEKTIVISQSVNIGNLIETLERMLPEGEWKKYTLIIEDEGLRVEKIIITPPVNPYPVIYRQNDVPDWFKYPTYQSAILCEY